MLREKRLKQLVDAGFVSFSQTESSITLNTNTSSNWLEDDTFFVDVLYGIKQQNDIIYFCLDGDNKDVVEMRIAKLSAKLISILLESGNRVSIGIIKNSPEVMPELAPIVEEIETEEKEPKVKKK